MSYIELRNNKSNSMSINAADIAKHLQSRQHLGKTIVICDKPVILMSMVRKHWLKLARTLQKDRAGTINAEKILRLTSNITHMHQMTFIGKTPEQQPNAHAYFITAEQACDVLLPMNTYSLYVAMPLPHNTLGSIIEQLPSDSLIIDYVSAIQAPYLSTLPPKSALEAQVSKQWRILIEFFNDHHIDTEVFSHNTNKTFDAADDALDILLGVSHHFLYLASNFQRAFELAQPFTFTSNEQHQYSMVMILAHRVRALNPSTSFSSQLNYDLAEDETFFLHDLSEEDTMSLSALLAHAIERHKAAHRTRLARALLFAIR